MTEKKLVKITGCSVMQNESQKLMEIAGICAPSGYPGLEIGSYIGSSTVFMGIEFKKYNNVLFSVDTHRGSSEHQKGMDLFMDEYYDEDVGKLDTFREFRKQVDNMGQSDTVIPIVTDSHILAKYWTTPLSMIFIDGDHDGDAPIRDYDDWIGMLVPGGFMILHDVWMNDEQRSQKGRRDGPYLAVKKALDSGMFSSFGVEGTLGILRRKDGLD